MILYIMFSYEPSTSTVVCFQKISNISFVNKTKAAAQKQCHKLFIYNIVLYSTMPYFRSCKWEEQ